MRRIWCGTVCGLIVLVLIELRGSVATAQGGAANTSITVFLVRHADRKDNSDNSPLKDPEGFDRAKALAGLLVDKGIVLILTSTAKRTVQTAEPLAKKLGKQATVTKVTSADSVASRAKAAKGNVLVVHHSNTVPKIIAKLGGPQLPDICESVYDRLFVVQLSAQQPQFQETQYGTSTPPIGCQ